MSNLQQATQSIAASGELTAGQAPATTASAQSWLRLSLLCLKAVLSAGLIYWIIRGVPLHEVAGAMRGAQVTLLLAALGSNLVGYLLSAARWRTLLRAQGGDATLPRLVAAFMSAIFFNNFLPSTIGGDALRIYDSWRVLSSKAGAVAVIFTDRVLGLLALLLFALVSLLAFGGKLGDAAPVLYTAVLIGVAGLLSAFILMAAPPKAWSGLLTRLRSVLPARLDAIQSHVLGAFAAFGDRRGALLRAFGLSVVLQANVVLHYWLIARSLQLHVPFYAFFLVVPLASLVMMLPISINGIGLRENAWAALLALYGVARPQAVAFAWLAFALLVLQGLAGGVVFALRRADRAAQTA